MKRHLTPFEQMVKEKREEKFRALSSKELRRLAYRKRAGLNVSEKFGARRDSLLAIKVLLERKNVLKKKCKNKKAPQ